MTQEEKPTILAIDDTPAMLRLFSDMLDGRYRVKVSRSGEKGLQLTREDASIRLVLLDRKMPGLDGLETCRRIRGDERTRQLPVLMISGDGSAQCQEEALQAGANAFLAKPFTPLELFAQIEALLNSH